MRRYRVIVNLMGYGRKSYFVDAESAIAAREKIEDQLIKEFKLILSKSEVQEIL